MMIRLFTIIFSLVCFELAAQNQIRNYQSFMIDNNEAIWIQVYHDENQSDLSKKLFDHLHKKAWITKLAFDGEDIIGELINYRPDYKRYGGKFINTSNIIRTGVWKGKLRINFKRGKYRVVLYGLTYDAMLSSMGSGKATIEQHNISGTLTEWVLNDYRTSFRKKAVRNLDILNFSFKDSFTIVADQVIDSDW
jgi:hypothetical protein